MITVQNAQRKVRVDLPALRAFATRALTLCRAETSPGRSLLSGLAEIGVVLVSDRRIAALHRRFMKIAGPTDVITFEHGEIFISTETAARQAREFKTSTAAEIELYIVHGLLHLHGFDDLEETAAREMEAVQARIFRAAQG